MNGGVVFLILVLLALVFGYGGWVFYSRRRASNLGLPPPSLNPFASSSSSAAASYPAPAPGGIKGWINAQVQKWKNRNNRFATGAYEEPSGYATAGRGRSAGQRLDPDEAWDARVGNEAYYEEQELGLHAAAAPYGNTSPAYAAPSPGFQATEPPRGRSRTRDYDDGDLGMSHGQGNEDARSARNPFGDEHVAPSLRGVSPRPLDTSMDTSYGGAEAAPKGVEEHRKTGSEENNSPGERRSLFRENI